MPLTQIVKFESVSSCNNWLKENKNKIKVINGSLSVDIGSYILIIYEVIDGVEG